MRVRSRLSPRSAFAPAPVLGTGDFSGSNVEAPGYPSFMTLRSLAVLSDAWPKIWGQPPGSPLARRFLLGSPFGPWNGLSYSRSGLLFSPDARAPLDARSGTSPCSEVPHPDTLNEAGLFGRSPRVDPVDLAPDPVFGIWRSLRLTRSQRLGTLTCRDRFRPRFSPITTPVLVEKQHSTAPKRVSVAPVLGLGIGSNIGIVLEHSAQGLLQ